jgi:hypothetical protein
MLLAYFPYFEKIKVGLFIINILKDAVSSELAQPLYDGNAVK